MSIDKKELVRRVQERLSSRQWHQVKADKARSSGLLKECEVLYTYLQRLLLNQQKLHELKNQ